MYNPVVLNSSTLQDFQMSIRKALSNRMVLLSLSFLSGLISIYDNVLNVVFYETLPEHELNPLASCVISLLGVSGLVVAKAIGTIIAVAIMISLTKTKYKHIIYPITVIQIWLFCFLTFHTNSSLNFFNNDWSTTLKLVVDFYSGN